MQQVAEAFEELRTEGLKVTKTIDDVVNWVIADRQLLLEPQPGTDEGTNDGGKKNKFQWRVVACLVSERFEPGAQQASPSKVQLTKQRLVHPCYIIDFQFRLPSAAGHHSNASNAR